MSSYNDILKNSSCRTIADIVDLCESNVPYEYRYKPWKHPELSHGTSLLASEDALNCYLSAYGDMHITKCRAAMMNFPFSDINGSIEIVDWGCGQGIGAGTIVEILDNRDLLQWVKKITLIEPSVQALARAEQNLYKITQNNIQITTINKYLPTCENRNSETLDAVNYTYTNVIHIFSNILDVEGLDLYSIARILATSNANHYVLCVGPKNANAYKIDQFCAIFGEQDYFSSIEDASFSRTIKTGYFYTCKSKCFKYNGLPLDSSRISLYTQTNNEVYGDYDLQLHIQNKVLSSQKARVAYRLQEMLSLDDILYINPVINDIKADFIIIRPKKGVIILNVITYNLEYCERPEDGSEVIYKINDNEEIRYQSPFELIKKASHSLKESVEDLLNIDSEVIKQVLVFTENGIDAVKEKFHIGNDFGFGSYILLKEFISNKEYSKKLYEKIGLGNHNPYFTDGVRRKIISLISPTWHSYKEGKLGIVPSRVQKQLSISQNKQQKISGVAGSGKTFVLALRAINAMKRTGSNVLILTYNITLARYLRARLSEIREDFSWSKIDILHYHAFFKLRASESKLHVYLDSYNNVNFFNNASIQKKYSAIFIDEVQDYQEEWLKIIKNNFLEEEGEFVVFGDPKQNIYDRPLDVEGNLRLGIIGGVWNKELNKSKRFTNPRLASLANKFQSKYFPKKEDVELEIMQISTLFNPISYFDMRNNYSMNDLVCKINNIIETSGNMVGDFVVLASKIEFLRDLDKMYRNITNNKTEVTFISSDVLEVSERARKLSFTTDKPYLKISTIQSFKGWDSPSVILILDDDKISPESIYTAITRPRENLYIINIGRNDYGDFFRSQCL